MSYRNKSLLFSASVMILAAGSVNALTLDTDALSHTYSTVELKPIPPEAFQTVSLQFLPDFKDSEFGWHSSSIPSDYSSKSSCSEDEYPLTKCPDHGICAQCNLVSMFKLTGCLSGYSKSSDNKSCVPQDCTALNSAYKNIVPENQICTGVKEAGKWCYKNCQNVACIDYTLSSCPSDAICELCPDCSGNGSTLGRCQPIKLKVIDCGINKKVNAGATACIDKNDVCEEGYKADACESGTDKQVGQTEAGTPCFACKANDTLTALPILYSDMTVSRKIIPDKTPIGVVFDEDRKLAVALEEKVSPWFNQYYDILDLKNWEDSSVPGVTTDWNGEINTRIIRAYCQGESTYCLDDYVSNYTTRGTVAGDWYLPAIGELDAIHKNKDSLNSTLIRINGTELMLTNPKRHIYWSSAEKNASNAWAYMLSGEATGAGKGMEGVFRPVIYYGAPQVEMPILYSDLTTSREIVAGKTPIGVVFDEDKKLAIALQETNATWSDQYFDIPGLTNYSSDSDAVKETIGKYNTQTILTYCQNNAKSCPAAEYVSNYYTVGTKAGDWYLPALGELKEIHDNRVFLNMALENIGGMPLVANSSWSSTEYSRNHAGYQLYVESAITHSSIIAHNGKQNSIAVRPVIKYNSIFNGGDILPLPTGCGTDMRPLVCDGRDYCCPSSILNCDQMNSGTFKCFTTQDKVEL